MRLRRATHPRRAAALAALGLAAACGRGSTAPTPSAAHCYATMSGRQPTGELPAGTRSVIMSMTTDRPATCRWAAVEGLHYVEMPYAFERTGGTEHSTPVDGLRDGEFYRLCAKCEDPQTGCSNPHDLVFVFNVASK
jgi:hypothetical protein